MNNKNISVWRGDNTPPTQYHLWLKNDGKLYVNIDEQWQEIDKDSISQITEILNQHAAKLDNHQTALDDINTLHSKLWTPGKGNWSIMSQGVKDSIGEDLTKGALGTYSYAEGYKTTATGDASHAEGFLSRSTAIHAHAEGFDSEAGGEKSHAEGYQTVTSAVGSHAEGFQTQATNAYSHAEGNATIADGQSSHAEGVNSYASNEGAHAEGNSIASGLFSHSENKGTASGAFSHAEGNSSASGDYSHAEGSGCRTEDSPKGESKFGSYCHVEGIGTICISKGGHTEGNGTYVAGDFAHAEGISSRADGTASHAEGKNTIANGDSAHAQGRFNVGSKYYIHSTGIGNENERKNAECIYVNTDNVADPRNGYTYIYGIGDYDGINTDVTTYKSLQEVISDIDSTLTVKADLVNGKIPLEQLGNLDMVLFEVVRELPTTNIKKHIYLMKVSELESGAKNLYAEYIYTGDITATYDASKWEKLGVKQIETDLSDYYTKEETDNQIQAVKNKFPLSISSFTATPQTIPVGEGTTNVTYKWSYNNEDVHAVVKQTMNNNSIFANIRTVEMPIDTTAAADIKATLKANDSLIKDTTVHVVNYSYTGLVSASTTTVTDPTGLTPIVKYGRYYEYQYNQANQKIVYLYPTLYGLLTSIVDQNGFEGISGFEKQTITINNVQYYLYISKIPATSNVTLTFK